MAQLKAGSTAGGKTILTTDDLGTGTAGATGGGTDKVFYLNEQTVDTNYTVPSGHNALSSGPVTISNGVTVTVTSGSSWSVV